MKRQIKWIIALALFIAGCSSSETSTDNAASGLEPLKEVTLYVAKMNEKLQIL